jgi:hypothetical protein
MKRNMKSHGSKDGPSRTQAQSLEHTIRAGEDAKRAWEELYSRQRTIEDSPFTVRVCLEESDDKWVDVGVFYSSRFAGGTTAEASLPASALFMAAELARDILERRGQDVKRGERGRSNSGTCPGGTA